mmetsp:Transcript_71246/g.163275  ORF Transcript_71246/g.163275 Transcript_71246/m.163275 type:complete len:220 (+) Transcript_71246:229-888(+)
MGGILLRQEGIAIMGRTLFQLTYESRKIFKYSAFTGDYVGEKPFPYEGWGLTTDGCVLYATTGSSKLYALDPHSLEVTSSVEVVDSAGASQTKLNELEYVAPYVWINVFESSKILRVDPVTGVAGHSIDVGSLYAWDGRKVPNGIAYSHARSPTSLFVTGKFWPQIFELQLSMDDLCGPVPPSATCSAAPQSACLHASLLARTPRAVGHRRPLGARPLQ